MRNYKFDIAIRCGVGYKFTYKGNRYEVIDNLIIYGIDEDWTYVKHVDF